MKRLFAMLVLAGSGWAYSSLVIGPGVNTAAFTVPPVAPFTSLGDYRVEFRIHDWTNSGTILSWGSQFSSRRYLKIDMSSTGAICATNFVDTLSANISCANLSGHSDVVVRVQRFGNLPSLEGGVGSFLLEAWDASSGVRISPSYCAAPTLPWACSIRSANVADWSVVPGYIGDPYANPTFSLAWLKWFSTTTPPGSPYSQEYAPADLADFRFEGNVNNQGTKGYAVSFGSFKTNPSYAGSATYRPACITGPSQTFRAGFPAQLDG
jgi:hypothetical protein